MTTPITKEARAEHIAFLRKHRDRPDIDLLIVNERFRTGLQLVTRDILLDALDAAEATIARLTAEAKPLAHLATYRAADLRIPDDGVRPPSHIIDAAEIAVRLIAGKFPLHVSRSYDGEVGLSWEAGGERMHLTFDPEDGGILTMMATPRDDKTVGEEASLTSDWQAALTAFLSSRNGGQ